MAYHTDIQRADGLLYGGAVWSGTGLVFDVSAGRFRKDGAEYDAGPDQVTLSASDPEYGRFDVIAYDVDGNVVVIEGDTSSDPVKPEIDFETQQEITFVYVGPGATEPEDITTTAIYLEDDGVPTEWDGVVTAAGTLVLNSTNGEYSGTKSIEGTGVQSGDRIDFNAYTPENIASIGVLELWVKPKAFFFGSRTIQVAFYFAGVRVSDWININQYGFDSSDIQYQLISIPNTAFNFTSVNVDALRIESKGTGADIGFFIDQIQIQSGVDINDVNSGQGHFTVINQSQAFQVQIGDNMEVLSSDNSLSFDLSAGKIDMSVEIDNIVSFVNGLTKVGSNVKLGGTLTEDTTINFANFDLNFTNVDNFKINSTLLHVDADAASVGINVSPGSGVKLKVRGTSSAREMTFADAGVFSVNSDFSTPIQFVGSASNMQVLLQSSGGGWYQYISSDGSYNLRPSGFGTTVFHMDLGVALTNQLYLKSDGSIQMAGYGGGTKTGTPATLATWNASGVLIEATYNPIDELDDLSDAYKSANNFFLGHNGGSVGGSDSNNTGVGIGALDALNASTGNNNTALGSFALSSNTSGDNNTAVGRNALRDNVAGQANIAVGFEALLLNTGSYNLAVGSSALEDNTTGERNAGIGYRALANNTIGTSNIAIGYTALEDNTDGDSNIAIGSLALKDSISADSNIAIGVQALTVNTTGSENLAIGGSALASNVGGQSNVAIGHQAMINNVGSHANTAVGYNALQRHNSSASTINTYNTAFGYQAMFGSATPANNIGVRNTALGASALVAFTSGGNNVAIGYAAGDNLTTASRNILIGSGVDSDSSDDYINIGNVIYGDMGTSTATGTNDAILTIDGGLTIGNTLTLSDYGSGGRTGAIAYLAGFTAAGQVIEYAISSLPSVDPEVVATDSAVSTTVNLSSVSTGHHIYLANCTTANIVYSLPDATLSTATLTFKKIDVTVNTPVLDGSSTQTVEGVEEFEGFFDQGDTVTIASDGSNWRIISSHYSNFGS